MCRCCCCCGMERHHRHHEHGHTHGHHIGLPWAMMDVEEEIKILEEYKEALTRKLEKVNKRLESLKR